MQLETTKTGSPLGQLELVVRDGALCGLCFPGGWAALRRFLEQRFGSVALRRVARVGRISTLLDAYFDGTLSALERIPVDSGGSSLQQQVWSRLRAIPVGRTASYAEIARSIGRPTASRAVATANAQNPIAVVVPCHRVTHADGSLSGYGGGGERKRWLLRHEGAILC